MIYVTSDLHFCHNKDFVYIPRGFKNIDEMNEAIVSRWNRVVGDTDTVYVLGDLMLYNDDKGIELLSSLKGNLCIICGNHDTSERQKKYAKCKNVVTISYAERLKYDNFSFFLSHYPTLTSNEDKVGKYSSVFSLHGHTHSTFVFDESKPFLYNVALDAHHCIPVSIVKIVNDITDKWKL